jgi:GNAT superfamily N-acetyltransferase
MHSPAVSYRHAVATDMPGISRVRTSVHENHLSRAQLDARGITNDAVAVSFDQTSRGWVAEVDGDIVGFSIAEREQRTIFALFVQPGFDGLGIGTRLLKLATTWLFDDGPTPIWLTTGAQTRAAGFYRHCGWIETGVAPDGQLRFELRERMA